MIRAEQIYTDYRPKVSAYVWGWVRNPHDVEDLVSAVFLKVVQKLNSYDPETALIFT